jgi:hypothetical protein
MRPKLQKQSERPKGHVTAEICGASRGEPEAFFHHATSREIKDAFMSRLSLAGAFWSGISRINETQILQM